jgi:myo-inositol-1(or 4)-monophosphatase
LEAPPITTRSALEEARDQAIRAALAAGNLIRAEAGRIGASAIRNKGIHDIVTPVDDAAQALILEQLETAFPDIGVLAEEDRPDVAASQTAHDGQACRWIVDPIDGTTNFAHGVPPYAVSIALECSGEIVVGVVYDVSRDELFTAIRGGGLRVNGRPAAVTVTGALDQSLVTTGFPYRSFSHAEPYTEVLKAFFERSRGVRRPGSASVDLA